MDVTLLLGKMVRAILTEDVTCFTDFDKDYDADVASEVKNDLLDNVVTFKTNYEHHDKYTVLNIDDAIICFVDAKPVAWFYCYEAETIDLESEALVVVGNDTLHRYYFETNSYTVKHI